MKRGLALLAVLLVGCSAAPAATSRVAMEEFTIEVDGRVWEAGTHRMQIVNRGEFPHTVVVTDQSGKVVAASPAIPGGETSELAVDLAPGAYQLSCRIVVQRGDGTLADHFQLGMHAVVEVRSSVAGPGTN